MRAITIEQNRLAWREDLPVPTPKPHEILVKVAYAGVNRADIFQRQGRYPPPEGASPMPGLEVSGWVAEIGSGLAEDVAYPNKCEARSGEGLGARPPFKIGDPVCALLGGGGYAEYCTVPAGQAFAVPQGWSLAEAAALPETLVTGWLALVETARLQPGEIVLIHGGASGIGSFAIPLAKQLGAGRVIATAGTEGKAEFCRRRGAGLAVNYRETDFLEALGPQSADVILDMVGGDYMQKNLSLLRRGGRLVQIAFLRGARAEMNLAPLLLSQISWQGVTLRSQPPERKSDLIAAALERCGPWLDSRALTVPLDRAFPLREAEKAHQHMEENLNLGKIVLEVSAS